VAFETLENLRPTPDVEYIQVARDGRLATYSLKVEGGHLMITAYDGVPVAQSFVPATVVEEETAEGLSDVSRARLTLEQAQNTASADRLRVLVAEALAYLGGPLL
jgi:hypothetical protein